MNGLFQDLRYGARQLAARPAFTLTAVLTLALGIGANATIYSIVNGLVLRPLPYEGADRLVLPWRSSEASATLLSPDGRVLEAWREAGRSFTAIEGYVNRQRTLHGRGEPRIVNTTAMSAGLFDMLALRVRLGRGFAPDDERPGAARVAILGHGFWQTAFGGRENVIGETLLLDDESWTIAGVGPEGVVLPFGQTMEPAVWVPLMRGADGVYEARGILPFARLRDGAELETARRELAAATERTLPEGTTARSVALRRPGDVLGTTVRRSLLVLMGAVALVLLVACANVANLLLARGGARRTELSVRIAIGAGAGRLLRQLLVESSLLALAGGLVGLLLAHWGLDAIIGLRPDSLREIDRVRLDGRVLSFTLSATLATALLFGLLPAIRATRDAVTGSLHRGVHGTAGARRSRRLSGSLIAAEVALSVLLMIGAGLLIRTLTSLQSRPLGFDPTAAVTVSVRLPLDRYPADSEALARFNTEFRDAVAALPGVRAASLTLVVPPSYGILFGALDIDGAVLADDERPELFSMNVVDPAFFRILDLPIRAGRAFSDADAGRDDIVIIDETLARRFLGGAAAVGRRVRFGQGEWKTVIGVAAEVPASGMTDLDPRPQLHFPLESEPPHGAMLLLDTDAQPAALRPVLTDLLSRIDAGAALEEVTTIDARIAASLDRPRFNVVMLGGLAALALLLSAIGLYGVVGYAVSQRTREIGIRRAIGASRTEVIRLILAEGLLPAALGLACGFAGALVLARVLGAMLYGFTPYDPLVFAVVPLLLAAVAALACLLPARRASRVPPVIALRWEA